MTEKIRDPYTDPSVERRFRIIYRITDDGLVKDQAGMKMQDNGHAPELPHVWVTVGWPPAPPQFIPREDVKQLVMYGAVSVNALEYKPQT